METTKQVLQLLDEVLGLQGRGASFTRASPLLGAIPELDSMAVASVITALEERFGFTIDDDPSAVEAPTFDTIRQNSTLFAISGGQSRPPPAGPIVLSCK